MEALNHPINAFQISNKKYCQLNILASKPSPDRSVLTITYNHSILERVVSQSHLKELVQLSKCKSKFRLLALSGYLNRGGFLAVLKKLS